MSKLSLHLQSVPGWMPQFVATSGIEWLKMIDPPEQDPFPGIKTIGRFYMPDSDSNALIWKGADGAHQWFDWLAPKALARTYLHAVEGPNEPQPMADRGFREALLEFTITLSHLMWANELRFVGFNFGVGWPGIGHAIEFGEAMDYIDYLGLHEYCAPAMWDGDGYYTLRYRRTVAELEAAGYTVPPLIIGECGIDGGVLSPPQERTGWRTHCDGNFDRYLQQLQWYSQELDRDNVEAAVIFNAGSYQEWMDFDIGESEAMTLADWLASDNENGNGGEDPYMDVKVFDNAGNEQTWDWLTTKYGNVRIQQPDADSYFKIVEIRERHADSAFIAKVLNADGTPKFGKTVLFYWDTAPDALGSGWLEQGVGGVTNENGDVGFGMGSGAWYTPPEQGPHKAWLFGENVSEMIEGIGMRIGPDGPTNHDHFNVTWQYVENGNGGNGDGDLVDVVNQLKRIADAAEHMAAHWPFAG